MCKQRERNGNVNMCFQHKLLCSNPTRKKVRGAKGKWIAFVAAPDPKTTFYNFHLADTFYVYKNCVSFHARREVIQVTSAWILKCSGNCFRHSWNLCGWFLKITAWKWLFAVVNCVYVTKYALTRFVSLTNLSQPQFHLFSITALRKPHQERHQKFI